MNSITFDVDLVGKEKKYVMTRRARGVVHKFRQLLAQRIQIHVIPFNFIQDTHYGMNHGVFMHRRYSLTIRCEFAF